MESIKDMKRIGHFVYYPDDDILGRGAFGSVYKGYDENNKKEVAIKVMPMAKVAASEVMTNLIQREIDILRKIKGENILEFIEMYKTSNNIYLITEFCNGGGLDSYIKSKGSLSEEESLLILKQITNAFIELDNLDIKNDFGKKNTIMHRDLKPANILLHNNVIKIADFGFAKMIDEASKGMKMAHTSLGSPSYMNPQTLEERPYSAKCDIWSAGVIFYQCLFGKLPWSGGSMLALLNNIKKKPLEFPKPISPDIQNLLKKMLQITEEVRIDWKGIWDDPTIKRVKLPKELLEVKEKPKITLIEQNLLEKKTEMQKKQSKIRIISNNQLFKFNHI